MSKKSLIWIVATTIILIFAIYAFAEGEKTSVETNINKYREAYKILTQARNRMINPKDGIEVTVREASRLLFLGPAWEGRARVIFSRAADEAEKVALMVSPYAINGSGEYPADITAMACWIKGNAKAWKMASTLRFLRDERVQDKSYEEVDRETKEIIELYKCALRNLYERESVARFGESAVVRYQEIIRKNFPALYNVQEHIKRSGSSTVDQGGEKQLLQILVGDIKNSKEVTIIPPSDEKPAKGYSPGGIGVH